MSNFTFNANAAPFYPLGLNVDAEPFYPEWMNVAEFYPEEALATPVISSPPQKLCLCGGDCDCFQSVPQTVECDEDPCSVGEEEDVDDIYGIYDEEDVPEEENAPKKTISFAEDTVIEVEKFDLPEDYWQTRRERANAARYIAFVDDRCVDTGFEYCETCNGIVVDDDCACGFRNHKNNRGDYDRSMRDTIVFEANTCLIEEGKPHV